VSDLVAFVNARLDEDEAAVRAASDAPGGDVWHEDDPVRRAGLIRDQYGGVVVYDEGSPVRGQALHIARYDPARALREVAAMREILAEHYSLTVGDRNESYEQFSIISPPFPPGDRGCVTCHYASYGGVHGYGYCRTMRRVASIWSDHPEYDPEWAPR
jgi:hypothetical protein